VVILQADFEDRIHVSQTDWIAAENTKGMPDG
jgi:hypothetical protein